MSVIYSHEELIKVEATLGSEFIQLYEKIWNERVKVKSYWETCKRNYKNTNGFTNQYWKYKIHEVEGVLENQTEWLHTIIQPLKDSINNESWEKLDKYLKATTPIFTV